MPVIQKCVTAEYQDIDGLIGLRGLLLSGGAAHYSSISAEEDDIWKAYYRKWLINQFYNRKSNIQISVIRDENNNVIGCATGIIDERAPVIGALDGLQGWVQSVVVAPEWRGQGLAILLMKSLFLWFESQGIGKIALQTTPIANAMYIKMGFDRTGEDLLIKNENNL